MRPDTRRRWIRVAAAFGFLAVIREISIRRHAAALTDWPRHQSTET